MESNFFKKFKVIASLPILCHFRFKKKNRFLRKSSKPGHGNLVLITSTIQVELSKLNFNFDDIKTYFLQVLRDCWQIIFVTLNGFSYKNLYDTVTRSFISWCHFSQVFRTLFNTVWKKIFFVAKFPFLTERVFVNAAKLIVVFQDYYAMMMLGRTRTAEQK